METLNNQLDKNEITCKNCGAVLKFEPGTTSLSCEYCGTENPIEIKQEEIEEIDYRDFLSSEKTAAPTQEVSTLKCGACGAETTLDPHIVSDECPFCGTHLIVSEGSTQEILKPKSILPFKIKRQEAEAEYRTWIKKRWWAPNNLKKQARQTGKISGMYIPYWTYDSDTYTRYHGERGTDYTVTETYTEDGETRTRQVTKIRWQSVSGSVSIFFDDVLVVASTSLPVKYMDRLEPWDLPNLLPFDEKFLSGFRTENYQVDLETGFDGAKKKMDVVIRSDIRRDIGGDHQRIGTTDTNYKDITFKHILLPIWLNSYRYKDKAYRFMVNGRTGEVQGEYPVSWLKVASAITLAILIIAAIYYYVEYYQ